MTAEAKFPPPSPEKNDVERQQHPVDIKGRGGGCRPLEREIAVLTQSIRVVEGRIVVLTHSIESGGKHGGTADKPILYEELSFLRRERNILLEKDNRLQERLNLCIIKEHRERVEKSECEDDRILRRVDSFGTLVLVSILTTGFSLPTFDRAQLPATRTMMVLVFVCEMFATIMFSMISSYAKQAYNYGSARNYRTARFLHSVGWITCAAQVSYALGLLLFTLGVLLEATVVRGQSWVLAGAIPILCLGLWCWVASIHALIQLRMGAWTNTLLLRDADHKLLHDQRSTGFPAQISFNI